ncbi:class I SAM-dependent methyltransferase [Sciscionella marina]|uniref:class I SAM-dependent methyltransferase n=1 Tax=Sciscionella marina TaxID=508770 RepID=UPI0003789FC0|nr:class I SAM-dependent methyltransferase [Sciscionella marina]
MSAPEPGSASDPVATCPARGTVHFSPTGFDGALTGDADHLELTDGRRVRIAVRRWHGAADHGDRRLLDCCHGPAIDLGCGPGRLVHTLAARGLAALGVDMSPWAVRYCQARGAPVLQRDVFGPLPGAGFWRHVLLADGNIGLGGDPVTLLRRSAALLRPTGTVVVEIAPTDNGLWRGAARVGSSPKSGGWFPWAIVGLDALATVANTAGLRLRGSHRYQQRHFAELDRECR